MSVYKKGDKRDDDEPKKNELEKGIDALGKGLEDMAKGISSLFGGGRKDKKWEQKGGGHTLGTAADAEAARQARMASLDKAGAASSSSMTRQPARPPPPAAAAAIAAAEARAAGGNQPRRAPAAPAVERGPSGGFPGPGRTAQSPEAKYASEITMLQEMGFRADAAVSVLVACNGDIEQAVSVLSADESVASVPGGGGGGTAEAAEAPVDRMAMLAEASEASAEHAPALGMALAGMRGGGACLGIIRKLIGNVRDHPDDPKYRKVRLTNPKIAEALGGFLEGLALLSACGFTFDATGEYAEMSDAGAAVTAALEAACTALDEAIACAASGGPPVPVGPFDVKVIA